MHKTNEKKAKASDGFSFTISAADAMKAARAAETLEMIRERRNVSAVHKNRKAYNRRDIRRRDRRGDD